jgi:acetyl-CoA synthetase
VSALPEVPDCVILAIPRDGCEAVVRECAAAGVGGLVVYASGFTETGKDENRALQRRITRIAGDAGMAVFGPNCLGVINYVNGAVMSFIGWPAAQPVVKHSVGIVSQSGSLGLALAQAAERGVSFSHVLTFGNGAGVDAADLVAYLAEDPACAAIVCVLEAAESPRRLVAAARLALAKGKPLIVQKIASGEAGASAALSHTGSLAGNHESYRATLRAAGAVWVEDFEALVETAVFFAKSGVPASTGVAVIGGSGGGGIMAADKAEIHGVPMPQPSAATEAILRQHIPDFGSPRNPCDVTAQVVSHPLSLAACCEALAADPAYGAVVSTQTVAAVEFIQRLGIYEEASRKHGKPICTAWMSEWHEGPGAREFERSPHVSMFHSVGRCFAALRAWHDRHAMLSDAKAAMPRIDEVERRAARAMLAGGTEPVLTERASKALLSLYGVPVAQDLLVHTPGQALQAADRLGYPVVLKVESRDLPHKSEVGGVCLNLRDAQQLHEAFEQMMARVRAAAPQARIDGAIVAPMLTGKLEILVGGRNDAQFGPLVTVGMGGVLVELLQDVATAPAPVNPAQAAAMLRGLKAARLLAGFRGQPAVDVEALAEIVSRASMLIADMGELLAELDINPLLCDGDDIRAADALVVRNLPTVVEPEKEFS